MKYKTKEQYEEVIKLKADGHTVKRIVELTGLTRSCVNNWVNRGSKIHTGISKCNTKVLDKTPIEYLNSLNPNISNEERYSTYSYLLGLYFGDGCIGRVGRTKCLLISLDKKYTKLNEYVKDSFKTLFNKDPGVLDRSIDNGQKCVVNCVVVRHYSVNLGLIFPHEGIGEKHLRKIELQPWQLDILDYVQFVKGLIHSDGSYYYNKQGKSWNYNFCNTSSDIFEFCKMGLDVLGISYNWHQKKKLGERGTALKNHLNIVKQLDVKKLHTLIGDKEDIRTELFSMEMVKELNNKLELEHAWDKEIRASEKIHYCSCGCEIYFKSTMSWEEINRPFNC